MILQRGRQLILERAQREAAGLPPLEPEEGVFLRRGRELLERAERNNFA